MARLNPHVPSPGWIDSSKGKMIFDPFDEVLVPFASLMPVGSFNCAEMATFPWLSVGGRHTQDCTPTVTSPMPPER